VCVCVCVCVWLCMCLCACVCVCLCVHAVLCCFSYFRTHSQSCTHCSYTLYHNCFMHVPSQAVEKAQAQTGTPPSPTRPLAPRPSTIRSGSEGSSSDSSRSSSSGGRSTGTNHELSELNDHAAVGAAAGAAKVHPAE
jgi:hypothetical protein